jgi:3-aminoavenalumate diazotase
MLLPSEAAEENPLPGSQFVDGLGSSEMGMALFGGLTTPETPRNDRCVGRPSEVCTATILDNDGAELPDGTVGLLAIRSPSRTPGYWKNPRLTASFELSGWWLTGDVARKDAEGNFYHLDRTVDVIDTVSGPVYSLQLEEVLLADCTDIIRDGVVIGVPAGGGLGQEPMAIVQLQQGAEEWSAEAILERANKELADKGLHPLAAVSIAVTEQDYPLGPTGKVLKRELRTKFAAHLGK